MIYPNRTPEEWAFQHGLSLKPHRCYKCNTLTNVDVPIISKDWVGFESVPHSCGEQFKIIYVKPRCMSIFTKVVNECAEIIEITTGAKRGH